MINAKLKKILYVEDEEDIRTITKIALEDFGGLKLKICKNGSEAIDVAQTFSPDLLLIDVMMPLLDGPNTLAELRKISNTQNTPAIFMTARVQPKEVKEYLAMGVIKVISKPFDPMKLEKILRDAWKQFYEQKTNKQA
jgi:two-component system, OmpR family, response regulator